MLMTIVHKNLEEGYDPADVSNVTSKKEKEDKAGTAAKSNPMISMSPAATISTVINVSFEIHLLHAVLYTGSSKLEASLKVRMMPACSLAQQLLWYASKDHRLFTSVGEFRQCARRTRPISGSR